jgi:hypothetical protein
MCSLQEVDTQDLFTSKLDLSWLRPTAIITCIWGCKCCLCLPILYRYIGLASSLPDMSILSQRLEEGKEEASSQEEGNFSHKQQESHQTVELLKPPQCNISHYIY